MKQNPPPTAPRWTLLRLVPLSLLFALAGWLQFQTTETNRAAATPVATGAEPNVPAAAADDDAFVQRDFRQWLEALPDPATESTDDRRDRLARGLALAQARRGRMERLMRVHPEQAILEALSLAEWAALPATIQASVEKPFSRVANYDFYPVCLAPGRVAPPGMPEYSASLQTAEGPLETFVYGTRRDLMSKQQLPVQGIALGGLAVLREGTLQLLTAAEISVARKIYDATQADSGRSFVTGEAVGSDPVHALAGGKLLVFANTDEVAAANERLAAADARPGLVAASSFILLPSGSGTISWASVETFASEQASTWTETKKKVFLIRVIFSNDATVPVTKAAAETVINGTVSNSIRAMSYQKTWIESTSSTNVYTLPQVTTFYANGGSSLNSELLRDARNTFRTAKTGGDGAVNIGPVSASGNGDGGGLGDYDIVGVSFVSIGMSGSGITYAGLAGGGNLWMQGNNSAGVYTHEFGHNYGIGHASAWGTTDGSVVGAAGTSSDYGDIFDIMGGGEVPNGAFHPQAKAKLDWLTPAQWADATVLGSNTYRIYRIDDTATTTSALRGVRVTKAASPAEYYWIGYRPIFADNPNLLRGAYLNWQRPGETRCWLLDTTPNSSGGKNDAGLVLGRTYADVTAKTYLTPLAVGGSGADQYLDVRVNLGNFPGNTAPISSAIAGPATVAARSNVSFSVTASDANNDALAYYWDAGDGTVNANSSNLTRQWIVGGTYTLNLTVSDMKGGVVSVAKTITVTDPIDTWTQHSVGTTGSQRTVVWGEGRFVVAEYFGAVAMSWDGSTWTSAGDLPNFDREPVSAFGNSVFVIGGKKDGVAEAQLCYSLDGRIWSQATFPAGVPQVQAVQFGAGKFLALADDGHVLASPDGITWTLTTVSAAPDFRFLTWNGTVWAALARNAAGTHTAAVWTSLNGLSWSPQATLSFDGKDVLGTNGVLYATGWYGGIARSTDHGMTWVDLTLPGTTRWTTHHMAAAPDGTLLTTARAMDESSSPYALLVSSNGTAWARSTANGGNTAVGNASALTFGAGSFLTVEDNGVIRRSASFYPNNTAPVPTFTANPPALVARRVGLYAAVATDAQGDSLTYAWDFGPQIGIVDGSSTPLMFAFGGNYTAILRVSDSRGGLATLTQAITVTDPARTFTQRTSGTTNTLNAIAANANLAVAVGGSGGVIRTSPDGVTWTTRTISGSGNITFRGACWDGTKFIIVGSDYSFTAPAGWLGVVATSPDGITWTRRYGTTNRGDELQAVASDGTGAVTVGVSGAILASADGLSWTPVTVAGIDTSVTFDGVAWSGSTYAVTGYAGGNGTCKVLTSTDRMNWIDRSAGSGVASWQDLRKIAWLNNRFVASGWYSKLRTSVNQGVSFSTSRSDAEETPAMAYGDGIYFTAGVNRSAAEANLDVMSLDGSIWQALPAPTAQDRHGAVFFKHTFITVGAGGSVWQSGNTTPAPTANNPLTLTLLPANAGAKIDYVGIPGAEHKIYRSPDLMDWTLIATLNASLVGIVTYTDSFVANRVFYRIDPP